MAVRGGPSGLYDEAYAVNNLIGTDPLYIGKVRANGRWLLVQYSSSAGTLTYANEGNNAGTTVYATAWTNRASLTYGPFEDLVGF